MFRRRKTAQPPQPERPGPRRGLGRKFALVLLPLAVIPSVIIGVAGYFQSRAIIERQAADQLSLITQSQVSRLIDWGEERTDQLQLAVQREELHESLHEFVDQERPVTNTASAIAVREELEALKSDEGDLIFSDILSVRTSDGQVLISTNEDWEGTVLPAFVRNVFDLESIQTNAINDDPVLAPSGIAIITTAPFHSGGTDETEVMLIGINSGLRLVALMQDMQVLQQQRGVFTVSTGETFLAINPDTLVSLPRYALSPTNQMASGLPIFDLDDGPIGTALYDSAEGTPVLGAYEWLTDWGLGVVVEVPQEQIFGELNNLIPLVTITLLIAIVLTVSIVVLTTNRMLQPLGRLAEFSERISQGEWLYRVPEDRNDELGSVAQSLNLMAEELSGMYRSLEDQVDERTKQIQTASEVARAVTSETSLDELLRKAVTLIRDQFDYYHVSIFLLDRSGRWAILRESTGEVGEALIARGHRLELGSQSVIGWVTENNAARMVSDVGEDPIHFQNELLPQTRAEAAVPLRVGAEVLGALDVQSTSVEEFGEEDIEILQTLADQLSAAIQNARLAEISIASAERARLLSDVTTQLSGLLEIDKVLETATYSLHQALGQPEILFKFAADGNGSSKSPETPDPIEKSKGNGTAGNGAGESE